MRDLDAIKESIREYRSSYPTTSNSADAILFTEILEVLEELAQYRRGTPATNASEFQNWFNRVHPEALASVTVTFK